MRIALILVALTALAACGPAIPDSGARVDPGTGVGLASAQEYERQKAAREAALAGASLPPPSGIVATPMGGGAAAAAPDAAPAPTSEAEQIAADTRAALEVAAPATGREAVQASPSNPPPAVVDSAGISRENSFDAVDAERTIEEDAARIASNRARYQVFEPEAIGPRPGDVGPNIVAYALGTRHPRGTQLYRRIGVNLETKAARACRAYPSADQAQIDFLRRGGPERDRLGLDPDGDGYACDWDPAPFRRAVQKGQ